MAPQIQMAGESRQRAAYTAHISVIDAYHRQGFTPEQIAKMVKRSPENVAEIIREINAS